LFVSSVLFVFWYHSPNFLDTPRIKTVPVLNDTDTQWKEVSLRSFLSLMLDGYL
jgi:hypothetical protein